MKDLKNLVQVAAIAAGLDSPERQAEWKMHHKAIIEALNNSHINGTQDALCVFEALAHTIAQLTANLTPVDRAGIRHFISTRADILAPVYQEAGMGAENRMVEEDDG